MIDAKKFTEDTGKSGDGTRRSGIHGNSGTGRYRKIRDTRYREIYERY
jgi:hypothetical protein